jgi:flavorubredoxin
METRIVEIADGIFRLSTFVSAVAPPRGFTFNQFLVRGDECLLFHAGHRKMFPTIRDALARLVAPTQLRWIGFGHFEADECGGLNDWLAWAPRAEPVHGALGCDVSIADFADRAPRPLSDDEVIDIGGGKRLRYLATPHTPHGWDAGVMFEGSTRTLLCGDLFTQTGDDAALTEGDIVGPAIEAEDMFRYTALNPALGPTLRRLAALSPRQLALMHGPAFAGDAPAALAALAADYDRRLAARPS